jgi:virulence-associated protein VapD
MKTLQDFLSVPMYTDEQLAQQMTTYFDMKQKLSPEAFKEWQTSYLAKEKYEQQCHETKQKKAWSEYFKQSLEQEPAKPEPKPELPLMEQYHNTYVKPQIEKTIERFKNA